MPSILKQVLWGWVPQCSREQLFSISEERNLNFSSHFLHSFTVWVCALTCTHMFIFHSVHLELWGQFWDSALSFTICVWGIELRTSGLVASGFAPWTILSTQRVNLCSNHTNSMYASWTSSSAWQAPLFKWLTHKENLTCQTTSKLCYAQKGYAVSLCVVLNW